MEERTYTVQSIHCGGCERTIREGLRDVDGIEEVVPAVATNTVTVRLDPTRIDDRRVRSYLADLGFPVLDDERERDDGSGGLGRYVVLVASVAVVGLAGYAGYMLFPRFDLPAVEGVAVLWLAAAAGVASFFSPCSFPLLLSILGRHATARARGGEVAARHVVPCGGAGSPADDATSGPSAS